MSIMRCPHCDEQYDSDTEVEHEEVCKDDMEYEKKKEFDKKMGNPLKQIDELVEMAKELKNDRGDDSGLTEQADKYFDDREIVKDIKESIIEQSE